MAKIRMTKNALRDEQRKKDQLEKYLPTLQLKKALLQSEVNNLKVRISDEEKKLDSLKQVLIDFSAIFSMPFEGDLLHFAKVKHVEKTYENIAGVDLPIFQSIEFHKKDYMLFDTPIYTESFIDQVREYVQQKEKLYVEKEKLWILTKELQDVSIRVNLFEKILIPRSNSHIKKIKVFLGDQELASVAQAKVAKSKLKEPV
ncbi:MAG TPA: V-type ATP synthase subunit D [Chlamydiales bacterium]|nr:V-type ATP synthase subunit D [Chlamydiales bacterium]